MHTVRAEAPDVRVTTRWGEVEAFGTLLEAILSFWTRGFDWSRVAVRFDGYRSVGQYFDHVDRRWHDDLLFDVQYVVEVDGMPVPAERLRAEVDAWLAAKAAARHARYVPRTGSSTTFSGWYRVPSHLPERRALAAAEAEREAGPRVRWLQDAWDDVPKDRSRTWKRHRRTQWKAEA